MEASEQGTGAAPEQESHETPRSEAPHTPDAPNPDLAPGERAEDEVEGREGPAEDQSPVATARDKAIVGDSGLFEQQPQTMSGDPDTPVRTSAPPAELQSGVPLPEDRAAGVQPGPAGPRPTPAPGAAADATAEEQENGGTPAA